MRNEPGGIVGGKHTQGTQEVIDPQEDHIAQKIDVIA